MRAFAIVDWAHSTNIYEVNLRQYTEEGTFNAFRKHLPRLKKMGVETLWFMPLTPVSQKNRKGTLGSYYACSDYVSINPEFGTMDDCKSLFREAQSMGFKIIIDWVANHTGWDHQWTKDHPEYYIIDPGTKDFRMASGMEDIIELNYENRDLRTAMIDAMEYWVVETGIDGFRCDLASWVTLEFWEEARKELEKVKELFWFGEFDELENPEYGEVFDASYSWKWMHLTEDFYKKQLPLSELIGLLKRYNDLGDHTMRCWFTSNHDENSWNGSEFEKYGEMTTALAVFSFAWNGIPLLYSGQELPNKKRLNFFDKDEIEWTKEPALASFYADLLKLRSAHPALRAGDPSILTYILRTTAPAEVFAWSRKGKADEVRVILNLSDKEVIFRIINEEKEYTLSPWKYLLIEK